ncbi:MAG: ABC transporter ATP-binding protein/permease [Alphaproteobacteria bacterium]|nr:ABC transporter ATP-binding protein/permease [Alphaproteobacteria bacterium]NCQ67040.1 ABC transporter ATP-binding protein/permease [Alphaproteobacteria bacterium]NCT07637.1 ABC transporter ATP-binding protein/permease [Alphaproteobacteria bacterium]
MKNPDSSLDKKSDLTILGLLLPYLWPSNRVDLKRRIFIAFFFLTISKVTNVYMPLLYKQSIDLLGLSSEALTWFSLPVLIIFAYGAARLGAQLFNELKDILTAKVEHYAMREVALDTFKHIHKLSLRFHLDRKTGGLSRIIERGIKGVETVLRFSVFHICPGLFEMIFVSAVLWVMYDIRYVFIILLTLTSYVIATLQMTKWRIAFVRQMFSSENESNTKAIDSLLNYETVKYFGNEDHETARYDVGLRTYASAAIKGKQSLSALNITQGFIISIGLVTLMLMAAFDVRSGVMTVGDFVLVNTYLIQLYLPLNILGFAYREMKLSLANMEEMFNLLDEPYEIIDPKDPIPFSSKDARVTFDNVSFEYNPDRPILKNVSFEVLSGKTCAIVGSSGAGKSTLSRLLFRFYDVTEGSIKLDGIDIKDMSQKDLRHAIGMFPQDTVLFNDTIYYNIAYGNPNAPKEAVIEAARLAKIHDFVESLPQGYETRVGERGLKLSGGEKQRVAIARTLLKRPAIFLFDEATSALDTQTEKEIQKSIKDVSANHTTLIIAHRLSTVIDADEIIVLDHGQIVERGSHTNLLKAKGLYERMWKKQLESGAEI